MERNDGFDFVCNCGCNQGVRIEFENFDRCDEFIFILYARSGDGKHLWYEFLYRMKLAWKMFWNGTVFLHDICLSREKAEEFNSYIKTQLEKQK
jgi:hypothetical protein